VSNEYSTHQLTTHYLAQHDSKKSGLQKTESEEAGLALSKLVSKLEAGNRIPDKIHRR